MSLAIVAAAIIFFGSNPTNLLSETDLFSDNAVTHIQIVAEKELDKAKWVRDISLPEERQEYLWNLCQEHSLDYDLMLAVMFHESSFNPEAKNVNKNGTVDSGYMQINSSNIDWVNELAGKEIDLFNPEDNILAGVLIFEYYQDSWKGKVDESILNRYTLNSYNMGITGYRKAGFPDREYNRKIEATAKEFAKMANIIFDKHEKM